MMRDTLIMRCLKLLHVCSLEIPLSEARNLIHMGRKGARSTGRMDEGQDPEERHEHHVRAMFTDIS